jgi:glycerate kinase
MRVVLAPNPFRGRLSAAAVADALAAGVRSVEAGAELDLCPLADGGDGTLTALARLRGAEVALAPVHDLLGARIEARLALTPDGTVAVEMADAAGVRLRPPHERDPFRSSTRGVGELIAAALDTRPRRIVVGAGGSGTIDVGAGALVALGARYLDGRGRELAPTPEGLERVATVDTSGLDGRLSATPVLVLSDVSTPLGANLAVYGRQKGVRPETADRLQRAVGRLASLAGERRRGLLGKPWLGAGGGLACALDAYAGALVAPGAEYLIRLARLRERIERADLVLTGEGCLDATSGQGKLPLAVVRLAHDCGVPAAIVAGRVADPPRLPPSVRAIAIDPACHDLRTAIGAGAARAIEGARLAA